VRAVKARIKVVVQQLTAARRPYRWRSGGVAEVTGMRGGAKAEVRVRCVRTAGAGWNGCDAVGMAPLRHGRDDSAAPGSQFGRSAWRLSR
jgi:hypothetical protein